MRFDQSVFNRYLQELQAHLFGTMSIDDIVHTRHNSHRKERFIAMYLLHSKETFHAYYEKRMELGIESIVNRVISTILYEKDKNEFKQELLSLLGIQDDMKTEDVSSFERRVVMKDINSFLFYQMKLTSRCNMKQRVELNWLGGNSKAKLVIEG